jgi:hypothetical protein
VDLDPVRIEEARRNAQRAGVDSLVQFKQADLFKIDLRPATVLTLYLLTEVNLRLRPRILRELRPGARVASHAFAMGDWQPDQMVKVGHATVYFWIVPAPVAGTWSWELPGTNGPRRYAVKIGQRFQMVQGAVRLPEDNPAALTEATLRGDELAFTLVEGAGERRTTTHYRGKVQGNAVTGFARTDGADAERPWRASLARDPGGN